jgi:hypothetical protein
MSDVCSIKISPALARIFDKHNDKIYILIWYWGIIRTYGGKLDIVDKLINHFNSVCKANINHLEGRPEVEFAIKMAERTQEFVNDFRRLSHSDIDLIKDMSEFEAYSFPITKINNQPIEREA